MCTWMQCAFAINGEGVTVLRELMIFQPMHIIIVIINLKIVSIFNAVICTGTEYEAPVYFLFYLTPYLYK